MLKNIGAILQEAGATFNNGKKYELDSRVLHVKYSFVCFVVFSVVKTTVLLADIKDYPAVNQVYVKCECSR